MLGFAAAVSAAKTHDDPPFSPRRSDGRTDTDSASDHVSGPLVPRSSTSSAAVPLDRRASTPTSSGRTIATPRPTPARCSSCSRPCRSRAAPSPGPSAARAGRAGRRPRWRLTRVAVHTGRASTSCTNSGTCSTAPRCRTRSARISWRSGGCPAGRAHGGRRSPEAMGAPESGSRSRTGCARCMDRRCPTTPGWSTRRPTASPAPATGSSSTAPAG